MHVRAAVMTNAISTVAPASRTRHTYMLPRRSAPASMLPVRANRRQCNVAVRVESA
jgi:hypothetical protein